MDSIYHIKNNSLFVWQGHFGNFVQYTNKSFIHQLKRKSKKKAETNSCNEHANWAGGGRGAIIMRNVRFKSVFSITIYERTISIGFAHWIVSTLDEFAVAIRVFIRVASIVFLFFLFIIENSLLFTCVRCSIQCYSPHEICMCRIMLIKKAKAFFLLALCRISFPLAYCLEFSIF